MGMETSSKVCKVGAQILLLTEVPDLRQLKLFVKLCIMTKFWFNYDITTCFLGFTYRVLWFDNANHL